MLILFMRIFCASLRLKMDSGMIGGSTMSKCMELLPSRRNGVTRWELFPWRENSQIVVNKY